MQRTRRRKPRRRRDPPAPRLRGPSRPPWGRAQMPEAQRRARSPRRPHTASPTPPDTPRTIPHPHPCPQGGTRPDMDDAQRPAGGGARGRAGAGLRSRWALGRTLECSRRRDARKRGCAFLRPRAPTAGPRHARRQSITKQEKKRPRSPWWRISAFLVGSVRACCAAPPPARALRAHVSGTARSGATPSSCAGKAHPPMGISCIGSGTAHARGSGCKRRVTQKRCNKYFQLIQYKHLFRKPQHVQQRFRIHARQSRPSMSKAFPPPPLRASRALAPTSIPFSTCRGMPVIAGLPICVGAKCSSVSNTAQRLECYCSAAVHIVCVCACACAHIRGKKDATTSHCHSEQQGGICGHRATKA